MRGLPTLAGLALAAALGGEGPGARLPPGWGGAPGALDADVRDRVVVEADKALRRPPAPVAHLVSAGSADLLDPRVVASRAAFEDADDAVLLALAWRATGETRYRTAAVGRLVAWAETQVPTGNPIDESRLDALVHASWLLDDALAPTDRQAARDWMEALRAAERGWRLGPRTAANNHRTHQLEMLLLLDRALGDDAAFAADRAAAEAHVGVNLDAATGESVDLRERGALYYHAYTLDAWLEIALLTGCCDAPVTAAWRLLEQRISDGQTHGEFSRSVEPLDATRALAGYGYGAEGSTFDPRRAEHASLTFATLHPDRAPCSVPAADVARRNLYTLARCRSWTR